MNYIEVSFSSQNMESWQQDLLIQDLAGIGFDSFQEREAGFLAFIPEPNFNVIELETLLQQTADFNLSYQTREIAAENWNRLWEENFQPIEIAGRCYVRASFHPSRAVAFPLEIVIDPKMAFGTGHHQTTSLMMEYILDDSLKGKRVLDMGCGTGILGILAKKTGAERVVAVDNDPVCSESCRENAVLNEVEIEVFCGSCELLAEEKSFDLIIANINRNILLEQLPVYAKVIRENGILLLSGFYLGEDLQQLRVCAEDLGFRYLDNRSKDNWAAARFIKLPS